MTARHLISDVLLWVGVGLNLVACLGVVVMRDVYSRLHYSSPAVLGAVCIGVAVVVKDSFSLIGDNTILIVVFLLVVSPIVTHAAARASRVDAHGDWRLGPHDDIEVEDP
jgi:monovalent cation/proton antiporter MnhG/PhaG subunit